MKNITKKLSVLFVLLVAALVVIGAGCAGSQPNNQTQNKEPIKIGFIGPLTGDIANLGEIVRDAVQLAENEINAAGGVNGRPVQVIFEDGKCNAKDALNAGNKLINQDKVKFIVGASCSSETLAVAPVAEANKVVMISPVSTNPDITNAGDYIFRVVPSDSFQGRFVAEYIKNTLGKNVVGVLFNNNDNWSVGVKNEFKKRFSDLGGRVIVEEGVLSTSNDLRSSLLKIKEANPDLIYAPTLIDFGIVLLKQAKELGITQTIWGGDAWDDTRVAKGAGVAAEGVHFTVSANKVLPQAFLDGMKALVGTDEMNTYAPRAYDAMYIFADTMRKVGVDSEQVKNALYQLKDYKGIADDYTMDQNGDVTQATFAIKEFKDGKVVAVQ